MKCSWHCCEKEAEEEKDFCSINCSQKFKVQRRRRALKRLAVVYKGGECISCAYDRYDGALLFHHLDPNIKTIKLGSGNTYGWFEVSSELEKCVLLCKNCHDEVHAGMLDLKPLLCNNPSAKEGEVLLEKAGMKTGAQKKKSDNFCTCGKKITRYAMRCGKCAARANPRPTKIDWPSSEELTERIKNSSRLAVSRELGVSDNAVKKRLKNHPPKG